MWNFLCIIAVIFEFGSCKIDDFYWIFNFCNWAFWFCALAIYVLWLGVDRFILFNKGEDNYLNASIMSTPNSTYPYIYIIKLSARFMTETNILQYNFSEIICTFQIANAYFQYRFYRTYIHIAISDRRVHCTYIYVISLFLCKIVNSKYI